MSAATTELARPATPAVVTFPCPARKGEATNVRECTTFSSKPPIFKAFCTTCTSPWRPCTACNEQGVSGPSSWIANQESGFCAFHETYGPEAKRTSQKRYTEDLGEDRHGILGVRPRSKAANPEFIPKSELKQVSLEPRTIRSVPKPPPAVLPPAPKPSIDRPMEIALAWGKRLSTNHQIVLEQISAGKTHGEIADLYHVAPSQISNQVSSLRYAGGVTIRDTFGSSFRTVMAQAFAVWKRLYPENVVDFTTARMVITRARGRKRFR